MPINDRVQLMKVVGGFSFATIFIVLALGVFIAANLPWFVSMFYWIFVFLLMGFAAWLGIKKFMGKKKGPTKIVNAEVVVRR